MSSTAAPVALDAPRRRQSRWLLVLVWIALTIALVIAVRSLPWRSALDNLERVRLPWLLPALVANLLILPIWAAEWRLLAPGARVPYARMFDVVSVMASVLNSIPFFAGEASGVAMLIARAGLSRGAAVSVLAMDQLLSGLAKLTVLGAAALLVPLPAWLRGGILALVVGVAVLLVISIPLAHRWEPLRERLLQRPSAARRALAAAVSLGRHLDAIRETHRTWRLLLLALAKKGAELAAILAVQMAFGMQPAIGTGMLVLAALAISTLMPVAPANLGVYEAMVFAAYRYAGVPADVALGMAVVQHLCFLVPMLATGYLTLTARQLLARPQGP